MKKVLLYNVLILAFLFPSVLSATGVKLPGVPTVWTVPAIFSADEEVTFYYDVSGIGFPEGVDLYLWAWQPTEPDAGNGDNSSDFAKLEYVGDNIYKKTMIPTKYFNSDVSAFESDSWAGYWQQLKTKDGSLWTTEYAAPDCRTQFKAFKSSGNGIMFYSGKSPNFTDKFTMNDPMSVLINPDVYKLGDRTMSDIAKDANFVSFNTHSGLNNWDVSQTLDVWRPKTMEKTRFNKLSNGFYKWDLISPADYYSYTYDDNGNKVATKLGDADVLAGYVLDNMTYLVVEVIKDDKGANQWGLNSGDQLQKAGTAEIYPDPIFSYFPSQLSSIDILTLIRQYNERNAGQLTFTLTAGSKTVTGTMDGNRDKRQATIDLIKGLAGQSVDKIHVTIVTVNGVTVVDTDIPLVPLSNVE